MYSFTVLFYIFYHFYLTIFAQFRPHDNAFHTIVEKKKDSLLLLALLTLMTPEVVLVVQIFCYQVCSVLQQVLFVSNLLSAVVHYSHRFY